MADEELFSEEETETDDGLLDEADSDFDGLDDPLAEDEDAELILEDAPHALGRTLVLDSNRSGFVKRGRGPMTVRGEVALREWIEKCLRTHEGAHPIHPAGYGLEEMLADYIGDSVETLDLDDFEDAVRDALTYHPAIDDIENFDFNIVDDDEDDTAYAEIVFDVIRDDGTRENFDMTLNDGEVPE